MLFAATRDQNIQAWSLGAPETSFELRGHSAGVHAIATHGTEDERVVYSASRDGTVRRWRADTAALKQATELPAEFEVLKAAGPPAPGMGLDVSPDQTRLAVSFNSEVRIFDLAAGRAPQRFEPVHAFGTNSHQVFAVAFSRQGDLLAVGGLLGWVALLDATTLKPLRPPLKVHDGHVSDLAFALDDRTLVSGAMFSRVVARTDVRQWRNLPGIPTAGNLPGGPFAVSADGELLVAASSNLHLRVVKVATLEIVNECPQSMRYLAAVVFSPDDQSVAFADESGAVFLWDLTGRRPIRRWTGHRGEVLCLAFSPDGRTLASGSMDRTIRLWHPDLDQEVAVLAGHTSWVSRVSFAAYGDALVSLGMQDGAVLVWRAAPQAKASRE